MYINQNLNFKFKNLYLNQYLLNFNLKRVIVFHFRYLNYMFVHEGGPFRPQDYKDIIIAVSSTPNGLNVLIDFLVQNINNFSRQLADGDDIAIFIYSVCASKSALDSEIIRVTL